MSVDYSYFAINYDVEFNNFVNYLVLTTNLFDAYSFTFFYDKSNIVFL